MNARSKYRARPTVVEGIRFASQAEARRFTELRLLERAGEIRGLITQVKFPLVVNGVKCGQYTADFSYFNKDGNQVVEDVKGYMVRDVPLRLKLVEAIYGIKVEIIKART